MVRYEIINQLKEYSNFTQLIASGIVPLSISTWLQIYETFLGELKENDKSTSIQFTADYYNISIQMVYKIINFMTS